jgi:CheY-like chemotaxis protein
MPHLDGFGLTQAIRSTEAQGTRLPIIAVTANAMQGEGQRCLKQGMDDYLSKPLRMAELSEKLKKWLPVSTV